MLDELIPDKTVYDAIDFIKSHSKEIMLLLVVNIKMPENNMTVGVYDFQTEFLSDEELEDFIRVLDELEIYRDLSYGEDAFLKKITSGYFNQFNYKYKIVYNTTGSRRIRSRSAIIPAICELNNITYASSDIWTSSVLENKIHTFSLLRQFGFTVPDFWVYHNKYGWQNSETPPTNLKLITKPSNECASIGISESSVSHYTKDYDQYIKGISRDFNQPIIVQEFIEGWEVEVPVFDIGQPVTLATAGIMVNDKALLKDIFLTYDTVYNDTYSFYDFSNVNAALASKLMEIAGNSFIKLDLRGTVRVDFRISESNKAYITDYNNSPHLTQFHSCAKVADIYGLSYSDMFCMVLFRGLVN